MKIIFIFSAFLFFTMASKASDDCKTWFEKSHLSPQAKDCTLQCTVLEVDMATFNCGQRCEEFCKPKKCSTDSYWEKKIKSGRPSKWDLESEKTVEWTSIEKKQVLNFLNRAPDDLKKLNFEGFFRMQKSIEIINPGSTSNDGKFIVIYDRAFNYPAWNVENVIFHEMGHIVFMRMNKDEQESFLASLGWKTNPALDNPTRSGEFISSRAKDSPNEDFAENFSYFVLEPGALKAKVPKAYKWFSAKFTQRLKLKEGCK